MDVLNVIIDKHPDKNNVAESQSCLAWPENCEVFVPQNLTEDQISREGLNSKYTNRNYFENSTTADQFTVLSSANFVRILLFPHCQVIVVSDLIHEDISRFFKVITINFHDVLDQLDLVRVEIVYDLFLILQNFDDLGSCELSTLILRLLNSFSSDRLIVNSQMEIINSLARLLDDDHSVEYPED